MSLRHVINGILPYIDILYITLIKYLSCSFATLLYSTLILPYPTVMISLQCIHCSCLVVFHSIIKVIKIVKMTPVRMIIQHPGKKVVAMFFADNTYLSVG